MSRSSQTEHVYVQAFPNRKYLCPDLRALQKTFPFFDRLRERLHPDIYAFKITFYQTLVRSERYFARSKFEILCVHVQSFRSFKNTYVQPFARSKVSRLFRAFKNVPVQSFKRLCPDLSTFFA